MITISVVITSYNQKNYLVEALESVLAQSWRPLQIIVADDCSKDGSQEVIRSYESRYPDLVTGIYHTQNLGISENRNSGIKLCTGEYIAILDGDDRYLPDNLEKQISSFQTNSVYGCSYSNVRLINADGIPLGIRDKAPQPSGYVFPELAQGKFGWLRSMITHRSHLAKAGNLDKNFPKHDGFILCLRLATQTQFKYHPEPLAEYRIHPSGDSKTFTQPARIKYLSDVMNEVYRLSVSQPLTEHQFNLIVRAWQFRMLSLTAVNAWKKRAVTKATLLSISALLTKLNLKHYPPTSLLDHYPR